MSGKTGISRRTFLKAAAAAGAGAALFPSVLRAEWKSVQNVILVRFGGGVRYRESFGDPSMKWMPKISKNLLKMGTRYVNVFNDGDTTHAGATTQLLTGKWVKQGGLGKKNPADPTIFECYRKEKGVRRAPPSKCVVIDHSIVDFHYNYSLKPEYGFEWGGYQFQPRLVTYHHLANVISSEPDQNTDIARRAKALQEAIWGREDWEHIEDAARVAPKFDDLGEKFVKNVFAREKVPIVSSGDELVLYFAKMVMEDADFQPKLLMINFGGPDIAHAGSYSDYTAKIAELDGLVDDLVEFAFKKSRAYRTNTVIIVTPECGRSAAGDGSGGFVGHATGDEGCRHVWAVFLGPGMPNNLEVKMPCSQIDIPKTIAAMLEFPMPSAEGKVLEETK